MHGKRLWQTLRLYTTLSSTKRTKYLKDKQVFGAIGDHCSIMSRVVPLYAKLIRLGNNVRIASKVTFVTHDVTHVMLNDNPSLKGERFQEKIGCIEIQDNVIIGAGSLVNKDIPSNSVAAGVPAKVIGSFDEYLSKRRAENTYPDELRPRNELISAETAEWCWREFNESHNQN